MCMCQETRIHNIQGTLKIQYEDDMIFQNEANESNRLFSKKRCKWSISARTKAQC